MVVVEPDVSGGFGRDGTAEDDVDEGAGSGTTKFEAEEVSGGGAEGVVAVMVNLGSLSGGSQEEEEVEEMRCRCGSGSGSRALWGEGGWDKTGVITSFVGLWFKWLLPVWLAAGGGGPEEGCCGGIAKDGEGGSRAAATPTDSLARSAKARFISGSSSFSCRRNTNNHSCSSPPRRWNNGAFNEVALLEPGRHDSLMHRRCRTGRTPTFSRFSASLES